MQTFPLARPPGATLLVSPEGVMLVPAATAAAPSAGGGALAPTTPPLQLLASARDLVGALPGVFPPLDPAARTAAQLRRPPGRGAHAKDWRAYEAGRTPLLGTEVTLIATPEPQASRRSAGKPTPVIHRLLKGSVVALADGGDAPRLLAAARTLAGPDGPSALAAGIAASGAAGTLAPPHRRVLVVINPHSGRRVGPKIWASAVKPVLDAAGVGHDAVTTGWAGHAIDLGRAYDPSSYEGVICVGGDGIFQEFVSGLLSRADWRLLVRRVALATVSCGTANALASGLRTRDPTYATWLVVKRIIRPLDAMLVSNGAGLRTVACCGVGYGLAADVASESEAFRALGVFRYAVLQVRHLTALLSGRSQHTGAISYSADLAMDDRSLAMYFSQLSHEEGVEGAPADGAQHRPRAPTGALTHGTSANDEEEEEEEEEEAEPGSLITRPHHDVTLEGGYASSGAVGGASSQGLQPQTTQHHSSLLLPQLPVQLPTSRLSAAEAQKAWRASRRAATRTNRDLAAAATAAAAAGGEGATPLLEGSSTVPGSSAGGRIAVLRPSYSGLDAYTGSGGSGSGGGGRLAAAGGAAPGDGATPALASHARGFSDLPGSLLSGGSDQGAVNLSAPTARLVDIMAEEKAQAQPGHRTRNPLNLGVADTSAAMAAFAAPALAQPVGARGTSAAPPGAAATAQPPPPPVVAVDTTTRSGALLAKFLPAASAGSSSASIALPTAVLPPPASLLAAGTAPQPAMAVRPSPGAKARAAAQRRSALLAGEDEVNAPVLVVGSAAGTEDAALPPLPPLLPAPGSSAALVPAYEGAAVSSEPFEARARAYRREAALDRDLVEVDPAIPALLLGETEGGGGEALQGVALPPGALAPGSAGGGAGGGGCDAALLGAASGGSTLAAPGGTRGGGGGLAHIHGPDTTTAAAAAAGAYGATGLMTPALRAVVKDGGFGPLIPCVRGCSVCKERGRLRYIGQAPSRAIVALQGAVAPAGAAAAAASAPLGQPLGALTSWEELTKAPYAGSGTSVGGVPSGEPSHDTSRPPAPMRLSRYRAVSETTSEDSLAGREGLYVPLLQDQHTSSGSGCGGSDLLLPAVATGGPHHAHADSGEQLRQSGWWERPQENSNARGAVVQSAGDPGSVGAAVNTSLSRSAVLSGGGLAASGGGGGSAGGSFVPYPGVSSPWSTAIPRVATPTSRIDFAKRRAEQRVASWAATASSPAAAAGAGGSGGEAAAGDGVTGWGSPPPTYPAATTAAAHMDIRRLQAPGLSLSASMADFRRLWDGGEGAGGGGRSEAAAAAAAALAPPSAPPPPTAINIFQEAGLPQLRGVPFPQVARMTLRPSWGPGWGGGGGGGTGVGGDGSTSGSGGGGGGGTGASASSSLALSTLTEPGSTLLQRVAAGRDQLSVGTSFGTDELYALSSSAPSSSSGLHSAGNGGGGLSGGHPGSASSSSASSSFEAPQPALAAGSGGGYGGYSGATAVPTATESNGLWHRLRSWLSPASHAAPRGSGRQRLPTGQSTGEDALYLPFSVQPADSNPAKGAQASALGQALLQADTAAAPLLGSSAAAAPVTQPPGRKRRWVWPWGAGAVAPRAGTGGGSAGGVSPPVPTGLPALETLLPEGGGGSGSGSGGGGGGGGGAAAAAPPLAPSSAPLLPLQPADTAGGATHGGALIPVPGAATEALTLDAHRSSTRMRRLVATGLTSRGFVKRRECSSYLTVGVITLAPEARYSHPSDGFADLVIARRGSLWETALMFLRYGLQALLPGCVDPLSSPLFDYVKVRTVVIQPAPEETWATINVDGEVLPGPPPFRCHLLPSLLTAYGEW